MYIAELRVENFRLYGEGDRGLALALRPGFTALVGENDSGKTAVMDALRLALGTRDQEYLRLDETDFHLPPDGSARRTEIRIRCKFAALTAQDIATFIEHLTHEAGTPSTPVLYVNWKATVASKNPDHRRFTATEVCSGRLADGPSIPSEVRGLLCATYLRPLRDAERAMSAGRGSRLSLILRNTREIRENGVPFDRATPGDPKQLSILGIGDYANALLEDHGALHAAKTRLNTDYLGQIALRGDSLKGSISVSSAQSDADARLRVLLEKLELELLSDGASGLQPNRGLGSSNLLFMSCEMLLLGSEPDGLPLLLIEEPEAHLHPQRQIRLMDFLQAQAAAQRQDGQAIQIIVSTHSPNLASVITLSSLVVLSGGRAFPLAEGKTLLDKSDYSFLERFLDVTKANLFFARGVLIVEGDAENILLPTLARIIGQDLTEHGVSIVNVGGTGLGRFARIFQRTDPAIDGAIGIHVACIADLDVLPNCAPALIGKIEPGAPLPERKDRRWRVRSDFTSEELEARRTEIKARASGQGVETMVADECTLEYDLAYAGLGKELWVAAQLAAADERLSRGKVTLLSEVRSALRSFSALRMSAKQADELASRIFEPFERRTASKAIAAQYLADILERRHRKGQLTDTSLRARLPKYIVSAIEHVTQPPKQRPTGGTGDA
jgi:putative ATP-dependent endonuclease of the OLD family